MRKFEHCAVIVHINGDLLAGLRVQHRKSGAHRDRVVALISCTKEGSDDALLGIRAAQVVVEDREESGRVDSNRGSPTRSCVKSCSDQIEEVVLYGARGETQVYRG